MSPEKDSPRGTDHFSVFAGGKEATTGNMSAVRRLRKGKCQRKVSFYSESGVTDLTEFVESCYDGAAIKALKV